jgi:GT2 family glycosyltransferase
LRRFLDAVRQQVVPPDELIVVDDGSGDETGLVVAAYGEVRYLTQPNSGPATARNRGWKASSCDVIAFADDDTIPSSNWISDLAEVFAADPDLAAVGGAIAPFRDGFVADFSHLEQHVTHGIEDDGTVKYLVTANAAWRREVLRALSGFDERFLGASGEDTDLTLRALDAGLKVAVTNRAVVFHDDRTDLLNVLRTYRRHGASRWRVVESSPSPAWGRRRRRSLGPAHWLARFRRYRAHGCSVPVAVAYLGLRTLGLMAYALGIASAYVRRRGDV